MAFWEEKSLEELSEEEFEALCDGCGRCCLIKLEDEDTGEIMMSDVHCKLFDAKKCRCKDYDSRKEKVPDCVKLTPANIKMLGWIPQSCAYLRIANGRGLARWHPLVSGDAGTVVEVGVSVMGRTVCEREVEPDEWVEHIATWPEMEPEEK